MVKPTRPPANGWVNAMRKVYNPVGFSKGYNFVLWFIACGYIFAFSLSRVEYFDFYGVFCNPDPAKAGAAPGECFYYLQQPYTIGIMLHLYTILPAGILVVFQFTPFIRHKALILHRINGYLVILLSSIASAGAIIVAEHAFGGDMATRIVSGVLVISTTVAYLIAWVNIKRLQIDQHRAWMMRAWSYFSVIVTLRLIQQASATILTSMGGIYIVRPCEQINSVLGRQGTLFFYPDCQAYYNGNTQKQVAIEANRNSEDPMEISAANGVSFGAAGWLALWIHVIIIELYLHFTPAETERLKQISYERQLARGYKHPGGAGISSLKFGDANPFIPLQRKHQDSEEIGMSPRRPDDEEEQ